MSIYDSIANAANSGIICAVCTIIDKTGTTPREIGSKMIVYENGNIEGSVGGGSVEKEVIEIASNVIDNPVILKQRFAIDAAINNKDSIEVLIEPILPNTTIVIIGAGHIGKITAHFAKKLGWHVIIVDDRFELCNKINIPDGDEFYPEITTDNIKYIVRESFNYVLCSRSSDIDLQVLPKILKINPKYIGILGSIKRWTNTKKGLVGLGFSEFQLENIYAPIGLEIGADTPEEIAVSIIAQIIKKNNHKK